MAKITVLILNTCLLMMLAGCATQADNVHMTMTYTGPEGVALNRVSKLKHLVMLPSRYEIDGNPSDNWSPEAENKKVQEAAIHYLEDWRDYRVKLVSGSWAEGALPAEELSSQLLRLVSDSGEKTRLPKETQAVIRKLATACDADGVLVLGSRYKFGNLPAALAIALFTMTIGVYPYMDAMGPYYSAAIFDAKDGEMVWFARSHSGVVSGKPCTSSEVANCASATAFGTLPNALPEGMLDPR